MSEILTMVRRAFCEVDMVDLTSRQEAEMGQHASSVSSLEQEVAALEERAYAIKKVYDELAPHSFGIEKPALNQMLAEVKGYLDEARKFRDRVSVKDSEHSETVSILSAQVDLGAKYPRILIQDVPFVESGTTQLVIAPIPLWATCIQPNALLSSYREMRYYCDSKGGSGQWLKLTQRACIEQAGRGDVDCRIGTQFVNDRSKYVFPGLIPSKVKKKITDAEPDFKGGEILLLVDTETLVASNPDPDPLVVGWHPSAPDSLWLIDAFDMTTVEQAINDEARKRFQELREDMPE